MEYKICDDYSFRVSDIICVHPKARFYYLDIVKVHHKVNNEDSYSELTNKDRKMLAFAAQKIGKEFTHILYSQHLCGDEFKEKREKRIKEVRETIKITMEYLKDHYEEINAEITREMKE